MLFAIIQAMGKEEARQFKLLTGRMAFEEVRVTFKLFDYLRKAESAPEVEEMTKFLYGKDNRVNRNRLYAIRNKLQKELKKTLLYHNSGKDTEQVAFEYLSLAKIFRKRGEGKLCLKMLKKAMNSANKGDHFHIKELIYKEKLALSPGEFSIKVEEAISEREENSKTLDFLRGTQNVMASVMQELRKMNFVEGGRNIIEILTNVKENLRENRTVFQSPKGRILLFNYTSNLLLQQKEFIQLEIYLKSELADFEERGFFDRGTHRTKIIMLYWLVNTTFKNYKFQESLTHCKELKRAILDYNKLYYNQFLLLYHNSLVNNYIGIGKVNEALVLLEKVLQNPIVANDPKSVFLYINMAGGFFQKKEYDKALKTIAQTYTQKGFESMTPLYQLRVYILEGIIRFEKQDFEFLQTRIDQIRKWFSTELKEHAEKQDFLEILEEKVKEGLSGSISWEGEKIQNVISQSPGLLPGEDQMLDYGLWLKSKIDKKSYFDLWKAQISEQAEILNDKIALVGS